jgi:hypothetical protein
VVSQRTVQSQVTIGLGAIGTHCERRFAVDALGVRIILARREFHAVGSSKRMPTASTADVSGSGIVLPGDGFFKRQCERSRYILRC